MRGDDKFVDDIYKRSQDNGFVPQFCFTVDLAYYSRRERDVVKRHNRIANRSEFEHHTQAGLDWSTQKFMVISAILGAVFFAGAMLVGGGLLAADIEVHESAA